MQMKYENPGRTSDSDSASSGTVVVVLDQAKDDSSGIIIRLRD